MKDPTEIGQGTGVTGRQPIADALWVRSNLHSPNE